MKVAGPLSAPFIDELDNKNSFVDRRMKKASRIARGKFYKNFYLLKSARTNALLESFTEASKILDLIDNLWDCYAIVEGDEEDFT